MIAVDVLQRDVARVRASRRPGRGSAATAASRRRSSAASASAPRRSGRPTAPRCGGRSRPGPGSLASRLSLRWMLLRTLSTSSRSVILIGQPPLPPHDAHVVDDAVEHLVDRRDDARGRVVGVLVADQVRRLLVERDAADRLARLGEVARSAAPRCAPCPAPAGSGCRGWRPGRRRSPRSWPSRRPSAARAAGRGSRSAFEPSPGESCDWAAAMLSRSPRMNEETAMSSAPVPSKNGSPVESLRPKPWPCTSLTWSISRAPISCRSARKSASVTSRTCRSPSELPARDRDRRGRVGPGLVGRVGEEDVHEAVRVGVAELVALVDPQRERLVAVDDRAAAEVDRDRAVLALDVGDVGQLGELVDQHVALVPEVVRLVAGADDADDLVVQPRDAGGQVVDVVDPQRDVAVEVGLLVLERAVELVHLVGDGLGALGQRLAAGLALRVVGQRAPAVPEAAQRAAQPVRRRLVERLLDLGDRVAGRLPLPEQLALLPELQVDEAVAEALDVDDVGAGAELARLLRPGRADERERDRGLQLGGLAGVAVGVGVGDVVAGDVERRSAGRSGPGWPG